MIQGSAFSSSVKYYRNFGNTSMPIMYLIGPPDWLSWSSVTYYFAQLGKTMLYLLTPLLIVAVVLPWRWWRSVHLSDLAGRRAGLWLWLLAPLVLLIIQPVKEPRHVAPCVVPAVLLLFLGLEAIPWRQTRVAAIALATVLALFQYIGTTVGGRESPYFIDQPTHGSEIRKRLIAADTHTAIYHLGQRAPSTLHWQFNQNIAIEGFEPNAALSLTWELYPGIVYDLSTFDEGQSSPAIPYEQFEDLFIFTAFNTYNRRCGWLRYYTTLSRQVVIDHADFLVLKQVDPSAAAQRFPQHVLVNTVETRDGPIQILKAKIRPPAAYRTLYGKQFLQRNQVLSDQEKMAVANDLFLTAVLRGDFAAAERVMRQLRAQIPRETKPRNIYWIGSYNQLKELANQLYRRYLTSRGK
jgi:hypothetical protein